MANEHSFHTFGFRVFEIRGATAGIYIFYLNFQRVVKANAVPGVNQ